MLPNFCHLSLEPVIETSVGGLVTDEEVDDYAVAHDVTFVDALISCYAQRYMGATEPVSVRGRKRRLEGDDEVDSDHEDAAPVDVQGKTTVNLKNIEAGFYTPSTLSGDEEVEYMLTRVDDMVEHEKRLKYIEIDRSLMGGADKKDLKQRADVQFQNMKTVLKVLLKMMETAYNNGLFMPSYTYIGKSFYAAAENLKQEFRRLSNTLDAKLPEDHRKRWKQFLELTDARAKRDVREALFMLFYYTHLNVGGETIVCIPEKEYPIYWLGLNQRTWWKLNVERNANKEQWAWLALLPGSGSSSSNTVQYRDDLSNRNEILVHLQAVKRRGGAPRTWYPNERDLVSERVIVFQGSLFLGRYRYISVEETDDDDDVPRVRLGKL